MFSFLFPISDTFIKLIMVRPFGNSHVLGKGFILPWCKPTVNFCFFNCCVILSGMIDACAIADRKRFRLIQLHCSNHYLFFPWGRSECRPQKKLHLQRDVKPALPFHQCTVLLWLYCEWWFHQDLTKLDFLEQNPAHQYLWHWNCLSILHLCL